jgi:hypothetical protein
MADDPAPGGESAGAKQTEAAKAKSSGMEAEPAAAEAEVKEALEDAASAAEGTRGAARWIASSLGAIPGLAVLASIVRAPGEAGFEATELTFGVFLAAAGAILGILAFANVLTPAAIEESELEDQGFDVRRLPGHPFGDYPTLKQEIEQMRTVSGQAGFEVVTAKARAASAEERLAGREAEVDRLKDGLDAAKEAEREGLQRELASARKGELELRGTLTQEKARLAGLQVHATAISAQLRRRLEIRAGLYRLASSDKVRSRYEFAAGLSVVAVALVSGGLILLGLAPEDKAKAGATTSLVSLKPNDEGRKALGCGGDTVQAIKVGGEEKAPEVITLPSSECPSSKQFVFETGEPDFGEVEEPTVP